MENEVMSYDEKANTDKLEFYCNEKIKVHIILKKDSQKDGKKIWINVLVLERLSERLWKVEDLLTRRVFELSISEINPWGIDKFTEVKS